MKAMNGERVASWSSKSPKAIAAFSAPTDGGAMQVETLRGSSGEALQAADEGTPPEQALPVRRVRRVRTSADREGDRRT